MVFTMYLMMNTLKATSVFFIEITNLSITVESSCNRSLVTLRPGNKPPVIHRKALFKLEEAEASTLHESFYYGYMCSQILVGVICDKSNTKRIVLCCVAAAAIWMMLGPVAIQQSKGKWKIVMGWNTAGGLILGPAFPALMSLLGHWIPYKEKTTVTGLLTGIVPTAHFISKVVANALVPLSGDWSSIFYIVGAFAVLACLPWYFCAHIDPEFHPTITTREKKYLRRTIGPYYPYKERKIPWKKILISVPFWANCLNNVGLRWAWFLLLDNTPRYLVLALKIDIKRQFLLLDFLPCLLMIITATSTGILCDYLIRNDFVDITTVRKLYNNFGSMGASIFAVTISYAACNQRSAVGFFLTAQGFISMYSSAVFVNMLDLAPNFAGTVMIVSNTTASLSGFFRIVIQEKWMKEFTVNTWRHLFWISLGICAFTNTIYALTCQGREQSWNLPPDFHEHNEVELDHNM